MKSCDLVYDEKTILWALQVFCDLGSIGGIKKGQILLLLDESMRGQRDFAQMISASVKYVQFVSKSLGQPRAVVPVWTTKVPLPPM